MTTVQPLRSTALMGLSDFNDQCKCVKDDGECPAW